MKKKDLFVALSSSIYPVMKAHGPIRVDKEEDKGGVKGQGLGMTYESNR